ncbi:hypothetical protein Taro_017456 [Colocasia esculenta]|uniref:Uncharacterized protein n=1 Tax=Colocasia esculenta TaxID=4460 RepID=A0A843UZF6_COLES|nr:hypothetical protein [Colocasia esculenta]
MELPCSTQNHIGTDIQLQAVPQPVIGEGLDTGKHVEVVDQSSSCNLEETKMNQPSEIRVDSAKLDKFSKHRQRRLHSTHLDLSVRPPETLSPEMFLPPQECRSTRFANSLVSSDHLPVLGLCAPNASQLDSKSRKFHSFLSLPVPNFEERRSSVGRLEFPFPSDTVPGPSCVVDLNNRGSAKDEPMLPEWVPNAFDHHLKSNIRGNYFPFNPVCTFGESSFCFALLVEKMKIIDL